MSNRTWEIVGWDGPEKNDTGEVPGVLTEEEIATMLQRLHARHLSYEEVVSASLRKNLKGYSGLLEYKIDRTAAKGNMVMVGTDNPHYVALRKRADGRSR